jgi:RecA-family ATPase
MVKDMAAANLAAALELAHAGIPVFPACIVRRGASGWEKKPAIAGWREAATTDEVQIRVWWQKFPRAVPGIELEQASLVVLDPDRHGNGPDGMEAFAQLGADIGGIPRHPTTDTPQGNHHIFRQNGGEPIGNSTGALPPGIHVRGAGGWIVAPGAVRPDGATYRPREGTPSLAEAYRAGTIPALPEKLAEIIQGGATPRHPHTPPRPTQDFEDSGGPVDVEAALADMEFESGTGNGVNATVCRVIPSLLRRGEHPDDVLERVASAVMGMAKRCRLKWSETVEIKATRKRVLSAYNNLLLRDYDPATREIPEWLPGEYHARWIEVVETGCRPCFGFNRGGFYIRKPQERAATRNFEAAPGPDAAQAAGGPEGQSRAPSTKRTLVLRPFIPFDPAALPQREWLYGKHYQRRTVSMTAGPGGMGKTSLGMVELVAMVTARNLLGEQPTERLRVWLHNGEDPLDEIHRRLAAICQHYGISQEELRDYLWITSGNEFPLRLAKGYTNLQVDRALVQQISDAIGTNQIDLAAFDPFVTMHSVSEGDPGKMDTVVRLFAGIADEHGASIELNHHVRKPAAGAEADHDVFDIRGVLAITDAVRAARILNRMNKQDAGNAGIDEIARLSHFRVDRAKGNYSPAQAATWRRFVNVELPNGDDVGVVTPWDFPGQGINTPEKVAAERKAEEIFLTLLRKFLARGINVSANSGPTYAPAKFATEREALAAKVSKAALKGAMDRLLDSNRIRTEMHNRERHRLALVVEA